VEYVKQETRNATTLLLLQSELSLSLSVSCQEILFVWRSRSNNSRMIGLEDVCGVFHDDILYPSTSLLVYYISSVVR